MTSARHSASTRIARGVGAAQRHRHPADHHRERIAPGEHAAMRDRHPRALVDTQRAQPLGLLGASSAQSTATMRARWPRCEAIECHGSALPERGANCN